LHVWLPDAMEGPTPVSALIHAATMVTAGVYMVTRCTPLFTASPVARIVVACIGGFTAVLAGLIALTQYDLKRVLAYSTISQLGYMFLALGTGTLAGITAGMFHLFTHAFFKALLFLGAGSVMHAMGGVIDMRRFGGLRKIMPVTHWTFLFGCLALAGIVPFAGFWSKDAILAAVHEKAHHGELIYQWLYYASVGTAFLTAFYTFRAFFMTFYGPLEVPAEAGHHAHESPAPMWVPLSILAAFACLIGFSLWNSQLFDNLLSHTPSLATEAMRVTASHERFHWDIAMTSTVVAVLGVGLAAYFYLGPSYEIDLLTALMDGRWTGGLFRAGWTERMASHPLISGVHRLAGGIGLGWLSTIVGYVLLALFCVLLAPLLLLLYVTPYRLSENKFYLDEIYDWTVVRPLRGIAQLSFWLDRLLVDGLVNLVGQLPKWLGASLRGLQWGMVSFYGLAMILGTLVLVFARVLWGAN
ncbi:MAG: hypothetical protein KDA99_09450, partial [Planctomycetales bacterium]|nr:hypothetical protein [Planctomycetales bacterium]